MFQLDFFLPGLHRVFNLKKFTVNLAIRLSFKKSTYVKETALKSTNFLSAVCI